MWLVNAAGLGQTSHDMSAGKTILVVDDDAHIREVVRFALEKAGYRTLQAGDGRSAIEVFEKDAPDLVVLDILMPEMDGTDVCRNLRSRSRVPIVFLSSKDDEVDRIVGLELGGDDYITKPFSPRELVARVRAVLRRATPEPAPAPEDAPKPRKPKVLECGKLALDLDRFQAFWEGREVVLTVTEFGILRTLMGYHGKVFTRSELMDGAYPEQNIVTERTIDSHVRRVRRKFAEVGGDPIETVHGVGYKLGSCA
jgi:two-component system OmpR family response regulator